MESTHKCCWPVFYRCKGWLQKAKYLEVMWIYKFGAGKFCEKKKNETNVRVSTIDFNNCIKHSHSSDIKYTVL